MNPFKGVVDWNPTARYLRNPTCICGHTWQEHINSKISDGGGGRIENDNHKCSYWEACGCEEFIEKEKDV